MSPRVKTLLAVGATLVAVNVVLEIVNAFAGGTTSGPRSSSYATADDGLRAYADLLGRDGHRISRLRAPLAESTLDPRSTLVLLEPTPLSGDDAAALARFVDGGGRLVAGGFGVASALRTILERTPRFQSRSATPQLLAPVAELDGVRTVVAEGFGSWALEGPAVPALGDESGALLSVAGSGRGRIVLLADPTPLQNRLLARADNAALGLALAGPPRRPVVFAEAYHGFGEESGIAAIPASWRALFTIGLGAAFVFMLARGRRLGPPEPDVRPLAPARREYVDAMGGLLARTRDRQAAADLLLQRARARPAARSVGEGAQTRSLPDNVPTAEALLELGRAVAASERNARRRTP
jgi:hypothetical protein